MKSLCFTCLFLVFTSTFGLTQSSPVAINNRRANVASPASTPSTDPKAKIFAQYGSLPLSFEANQGQVGRQVNFLSRTNGYSLFLASDEAVFALSTTKRDTYNAKNAGHARMPQSGVNASKGGGVLRMKLVNANAAAKVTGVNELPGKTNYFIGNDPKKWRTNIPTFAKVKYEGVYSGIDLVYYGNQKKVEYDFVVAPGADPRCIQFEVRGTTKINRDRNGDLVLHMAEGEIRWQRPFVYQETDGVRREIAAHYVVQNANRVAFGLAKYDASKPLYIDPVIYSTYLGGGQDVGVGITTDSSGNAYVVGQAGYNFPVTSGAFQPVNDGPVDGFVSKINPAGSALIYSTYLGGSSQLRYNYDGASGIAVDSSGNAYVTGSTSSTNFPTTPSAFQTTLNGTQNAFVTELNPTGSALIYSTYLGGSSFDEGRGIALDSLGNAYVTGSTSSTNFPVTPGAFQTTNGGGLVDAFVTRLNPSGSALVYSTYLGGSSFDVGAGIAVDSSRNAYVVGSTSSPNFPTTPGSFQTSCGNSCANEYAFVSKLNSAGSALIYSTYLGDSSGGAIGLGIVVGSSGDAYVTGGAGLGFPSTPGAFQTTLNGPQSAFVTELNSTGSALIYSTYLGGSSVDEGTGIALDSSGNTYITGETKSTNFPVTPGAFQKTCGGGCSSLNSFVSEINPTGSALVYSTYLGGSGNGLGGGDVGYAIAVDSSGNTYVTGLTNSTDFPTVNPLQPNYEGGTDAFVAKFSANQVLSPWILKNSSQITEYSSASSHSCAPMKVTAGDLLLSYNIVYNGSTSGFILINSDSQSNLWNVIQTESIWDDSILQIEYARASMSGNDTIEVRTSSNVSVHNIGNGCEEWSGGATSGAILDASGAAKFLGKGGVAYAGAVTNGANDLVVGLCVFPWDSGYSDFALSAGGSDTQDVFNNFLQTTSVFQVGAGPGNQTVNCTTSGPGSTWSAIIAAFRY